MMEIVKVLQAQAVGGYCLRLVFSNGLGGVRDLSDVIASGGAMIGPMADPRFFARVFVQNGVPVWPHGFDLDAIALFQEMQAAGLLVPAAIEAV
jgi:hypothetical protein